MPLSHRIMSFIGLTLLASLHAQGATIRFPSQIADLQLAVDLAQDGDTVLIERGVYITTGAAVPNRAITIRGEGDPGEVQMLFGGSVPVPPPTFGSTVFLFQGNGPETVLENIEFAVLILYPQPGSAITTIDAAPTIRGCRFVTTLSSPIATFALNPLTPAVVLEECVFINAGNPVIASHDTIIRRCTFDTSVESVFTAGTHVVANSDFGAGSGSAIRVEGGAVNVINCLISGYSASGIVSSGGETNIYNSTIIGNGNGSALSGGVSWAGSVPTSISVYNSVVAGNVPLDISIDPFGTGEGQFVWDIQSSLVENMDQGGPSPRTASGYSPDLGRLLFGASEIDSGDDSLLPADLADLDGDGDSVEILPVDRIGFPRIAGQRVDQGAHEGFWFERIGRGGAFLDDEEWIPGAPSVRDAPLFAINSLFPTSATFDRDTATLPFLIRPPTNLTLQLSGSTYFADGIGEGLFAGPLEAPPSLPSVIEAGAALRVENGALVTHKLDLLGTLTVSPDAETVVLDDLIVEGRLDGAGIVRAPLVTNLGMIAADGAEPMVIDARLRQSRFADSGRIELTMAPTSLRTGAPVLEITGHADLSGTLGVVAPAGFDPPVKTPIPLISAESFGGRFDLALLPALPDRFLSLVYPIASNVRGQGATISVQVNPLDSDLVFNPAPSTDSGAANPSAAKLADINADGFLDLLLTLPDPTSPESEPGSVLVFYNDGLAGDGSWAGFANVSAAQQIFEDIGIFPSALDVADLNADGAPDLIVTNRGPAADDDPVAFTRDSVTVLINDATPPGLFEPGQTAVLTVGNRPIDVFAADLDDDDLPDIAVLNAGTEDLLVLWNEGPSSRAAGRATPWITPDPIETDRLELPEESCPMSIRPGDFDASIHIAIAYSGSDSVSIVFNGGSRDLELVGNAIPVGMEPVRLLVVDLNLDGTPDILTIDRVGDTISIITSLSIVEGVPSPRLVFEPAAQLPIGGTSPSSVAAGDFDQDGDPDLAVVAIGAQARGVVKVLRNDLFEGQLGFTPAPDQPSPDPLFVLAGDVNDDDRADLVTVNASAAASRGQEPSGELRTFLAFAPPVCCADLDDDGDTDRDDYTLFRAAFGSIVEPGTGADLDASGRVDVFDLTLFINDLNCAVR